MYTSACWIYKKPQQTINLILLLWQTRKILFYWLPNYGMLEEEIFIFCRMHAYFPIKFVKGLLSPSLSAHRVLSPYSVLSNKPLILLSLIYVDNPYIYIYIYYFLDCCKVRTSERELCQWAGDRLCWCGMDISVIIIIIHTYIYTFKITVSLAYITAWYWAWSGRETLVYDNCQHDSITWKIWVYLKWSSVFEPIYKELEFSFLLFSFIFYFNL